MLKAWFIGKVRKYYKRITKYLKLKKNRRIKNALEQLYPLKEQDNLYEEYQVKKLCVMCGIVLIGMVSVLCLCLCSQTKVKVAEREQSIEGERGTDDDFAAVQENRYVWFLILTPAAALGVAAGMDRDLEKCCKERRKRLALEYPDFVSKLRLYLSAGMTVKMTFYKLAEDYQGRFSKGNYLWEELRLACNCFLNGMPEEKVYRAWGRRCMELKYRRLSVLLCNYLKIGSGRLLSELEAEEESAREERKQQARKIGEEAGVKLLFPMLLQLLVVLFLILIPAYMDFGAI